VLAALRRPCTLQARPLCVRGRILVYGCVWLTTIQMVDVACNQTYSSYCCPNIVNCLSVVYGYGNFAILIQSENFFMNSIPHPYPKIKNFGLRYPIQIRNRSLSCTLAYIFGCFYFASLGKICGYSAFCQMRLVEVVM